jgi:outer membrane protein TolC
MYRVGESRQADVLRAQVEIARMVQDTIRMTTMRSAMAARLNAIIDLPAQALVETPLLPAFPDFMPGLDGAIRTAVADRPMVRVGKRDLEAATDQTR